MQIGMKTFTYELIGIVLRFGSRSFFVMNFVKLIAFSSKEAFQALLLVRFYENKQMPY